MSKKYTENQLKKLANSNGSLDTLETTRHNPRKQLGKRARSKWYTQRIVGSMLYLESPLHKTYQSAYYCNSVLHQKEGKIIGHYCNTRICHVCNRIRTAKLMNGYISQLDKRSLQFVTLTLPNCTASELPGTVKMMIKTVSNIVKVYRVRRKQPLHGVRKIEVTYNSKSDTYHPHIHMLIDGDGDGVIDEWLLRIPTAKKQAQDVRDADTDSLSELFKYATKFLAKTGDEITVYVRALDVIMLSIRGIRLFQPFGNIRKVSEDVTDDLESVYTENQDFITWIWHNEDWIDEDSGECLTGYTPPKISVCCKV